MQPPATTLPDIDLVEAARDGDHAAFSQLLQLHDDRMRGLAYRLLADRARTEVALEEAYLRAWRGLHRFKAGRDVGTWLYRVTYNACIDELRRQKQAPRVAPGTDGPGTDGPDGSGSDGAGSDGPGPEREVTAAESVRRALGSLPDDQRITVVLVDGEGFDHREAAEILGVAPATVASRLHPARAALRAVLGAELS